MEEFKEIRIVLNEDKFTHLCKVGFLKHQSPHIGFSDIQFFKKDILDLCKGEIVTKDVANEIFKFAISNIPTEMIREIVKRSPIFYELSNQI